MQNEEAVYLEAFNLLCGNKIGEGIHRKVFACKLRPELVVKVEDDDYRYFANVLEMRFWNDNEYYEKVSSWLAPCEYLSPDGRILLQRRCDPIPSSMKMPTKVPSFLTDLKRSNFGLYKGKIVSLDYALNISNPSTRMVNSYFT